MNLSPLEVGGYMFSVQIKTTFMGETAVLLQLQTNGHCVNAHCCETEKEADSPRAWTLLWCTRGKTHCGPLSSDFPTG